MPIKGAERFPMMPMSSKAPKNQTTTPNDHRRSQQTFEAHKKAKQPIQTISNGVAKLENKTGAKRQTDKIQRRKEVKRHGRQAPQATGSQTTIVACPINQKQSPNSSTTTRHKVDRRKDEEEINSYFTELK